MTDWQRIDSVFAEALEVSDDEREQWLRDRCRDDADLLREVQKLLAAEYKSREFLARPVDVLFDETVETFGAYRVIRKIGQGGMGEVFLAERADGEFEQRVAVKQLAYPTPGLLARFKHERRLLAKLEHPSIARLIDGGVDQRGIPYFVMEYVDGVTITRYANDKKLDVRQRVSLLLEACEAVQFAHQNLIVHRDLKPSNILVTADGKPRLLDFGIAKTLAEDDSAATATVERLLTPDYAAPEQIRGEVVTTATDVYALGVLLYELSTGTRPAPSLRDIDDVPLPSTRVIAHGVSPRGVRGDLDRIIRKAMARDPAQRYATVDAFGADLRRFLAGRPISVRAESKTYVLRKFIRRNRVAVLAASAVFLAILVGALAVLWEAHEARLSAMRAQAQAKRAQAAQQFLIEMFDQLDPENSHGKPVSAQDLLDAGTKMLEQRKDDPPALKAELANTMVNLYFDIGDYSRTLDLAKRAVAMNSEPGMPALAQAHNLQNLGGLEYRDFKYDDALAHFQTALELSESTSDDGEDDSQRAETVSRLRAQIAMTLNAKGESAQAESMMRSVLAADRARVGDNTHIVADEWDELGQVLRSLRKFSDSRAAIETAIATYKSLGSEPMAAAGLRDLGDMLNDANLLADAEKAQREALDINTRILGADHRDTILNLGTLADTIQMRGHFADALPMRQRVLAATRAQFGEHSAQTAIAWQALGRTLISLGRMREGADAIQKSIDDNLAVFGENSMGVSIARYAMGEPLMNMGRYDDAERETRKSLDIVRVLRPGDAREVELRELQLAEIDRRAGRSIQASKALKDLVDRMRITLGELDPTTNYALTELGWSQLEAGDIANAIGTLEQTLKDARAAFPAGSYRLASPLIILGRAYVAAGRAAEAEPLLREARQEFIDALGVDSHAVASADIALAESLIAQSKNDEARNLVAGVPAKLANSEQDDTELHARLAALQDGSLLKLSKRPTATKHHAG